MKSLLKIATFLFLGQACVVFLFVLERLLAVLSKLFMFHLEWPQPIYLSREMMTFFVVYSAVAVSVGAALMRAISNISHRINFVARWGIGLNVGAVFVVALMILVNLAVMTGAGT